MMKRLIYMCFCVSVMVSLVACIGIEGAPVAPDSPAGVTPPPAPIDESTRRPPQHRASPTNTTEPAPTNPPPINSTEPTPPPPTEPPPPTNPPTDPPPPPPTEPPPPPSSGPSCADIQQASCQKDADCPSDKPYCSNEIFLTNGVQFRTCLPCKGHAFAEGMEDSSCKEPETWTRYGGDGCKAKGFKLYQMVPCMKCKTPEDGNFARVVQLCVENTCPVP